MVRNYVAGASQRGSGRHRDAWPKFCSENYLDSPEEEQHNYTMKSIIFLYGYPTLSEVPFCAIIEGADPIQYPLDLVTSQGSFDACH